MRSAGATTFMFGQSLDGASIAFEAKGRPG